MITLALWGGPPLTPSPYALGAAVHDVPAEEVVVLPNSANVFMAAEHAAKLSDKQVLVAPTTSQQAGLAAAVTPAPGRSAEEKGTALTEVVAYVRPGAGAPPAAAGAEAPRPAGGARRLP